MTEISDEIVERASVAFKARHGWSRDMTFVCLAMRDALSAVADDLQAEGRADIEAARAESYVAGVLASLKAAEAVIADSGGEPASEVVALLRVRLGALLVGKPLAPTERAFAEGRQQGIREGQAEGYERGVRARHLAAYGDRLDIHDRSRGEEATITVADMKALLARLAAAEAVVEAARVFMDTDTGFYRLGSAVDAYDAARKEA